MIEWISALEWYNAKLKQAKKVLPLTKQETLRKRLATIVLDKYLKKACDTTATESLRKLALKDNKDCPLLLNLAKI